MNLEDEHRKFRKQYSDEEWARLVESVKFMEAFNADNFVEMGAVADRIIEGETKRISDARLRKQLNRLPY